MKTNKRLVVAGIGALAELLTADLNNTGYGVRTARPRRRPEDKVSAEDEMEEPNPRTIEYTKCYRTGCDNHRTKGKLYCSSECCKLDRMERKTN